jgi:hypothetical protein
VVHGGSSTGDDTVVEEASRHIEEAEASYHGYWLMTDKMLVHSLRGRDASVLPKSDRFGVGP